MTIRILLRIELSSFNRRYPTLLIVENVSAKQVNGQLRIYVEYREFLLQTFPQGWAIVFKASVIKIQKHVCHETSGSAAEVPSGEVEESKRSLIVVSDVHVITTYVPMYVCLYSLEVNEKLEKEKQSSC
jgi:hypothetical protein